MQKTPLELAQEAVAKANEQVQTAQNELDELKLAFTLQWFEDKNCVDQGNEYLQTGEWKLAIPKHQLILYLNQNRIP